MRHKLEADSIRKSYGNRIILNDIYLSCSTGEIIGLLGLNGSGKSTLLKIIFGIVNTPNKSVRVDSRYYKTPYLIPGLISYLPQETILPPAMTVKRILKSVLDTSQLNRVISDERINPHLNKSTKQLSGGERKYLEICLVMALKKKFVMLDEPFTGIEPIYREIIGQKIKEGAADQGIIISDHDYMNVLSTSTRQYYLSNGNLKPSDGLNDLSGFGYLNIKDKVASIP